MNESINNLNSFLFSGKKITAEELEEVNQKIQQAISTINNLGTLGVENLKYEEIKHLEIIIFQLNPILLENIKQQINLKDIKVNFEIDKNLDLSDYENLAKLVLLKQILKKININVNLDEKNIKQQFDNFNKKITKNLNLEDYLNLLKKNNIKKILEIKENYKIDFMPFEYIFDNIDTFTSFIEQIAQYMLISYFNTDTKKFLSEIIQKNLVKFFYKIIENKTKKYDGKANKILMLYLNYFKVLYLPKVRNEIIHLFGEIAKNFDFTQEFKENILLNKNPDKLIRFAYVKYYPFLYEIIKEIESEELKLGFVSTLVFIERLLENNLENKYANLIKKLYTEIIQKRLENNERISKAKLEYYNNFCKKYPNFKVENLLHTTQEELIKNLKKDPLKHISSLEEFIQLHQNGLINKKLNKKNLKSLIQNQIIHIKDINYLLEKDLINMKNKDFIEIILPNLSNLGFLILSKNPNFKSLITKDRIIKLLLNEKNYRFLIILENLNYSLTPQEQSKIFNSLIKKKNITELEKKFLAGFSLFKDINTNS